MLSKKDCILSVLIGTRWDYLRYLIFEDLTSPGDVVFVLLVDGQNAARVAMESPAGSLVQGVFTHQARAALDIVNNYNMLYRAYN